jgi:hypothetical protein
VNAEDTKSAPEESKFGEPMPTESQSADIGGIPAILYH